jgi:hypothetical protein
LKEKGRTYICGFKKGVLRRIFGPKNEDVAGGWKTLHNEKLLILYVSPNIIRTVKSRRIRWAGHVTRIGDTKNHTCTKFWSENPKRRDYSQNEGTNGKILDSVLGKKGGKVQTGCIWLRTGTSGRLVTKVMNLRVPQNVENLSR